MKKFYKILTLIFSITYIDYSENVNSTELAVKQDDNKIIEQSNKNLTKKTNKIFTNTCMETNSTLYNSTIRNNIQNFTNKTQVIPLVNETEEEIKANYRSFERERKYYNNQKEFLLERFKFSISKIVTDFNKYSKTFTIINNLGIFPSNNNKDNININELLSIKHSYEFFKYQFSNLSKKILELFNNVQTYTDQCKVLTDTDKSKIFKFSLKISDLQNDVMNALDNVNDNQSALVNNTIDDDSNYYKRIEHILLYKDNINLVLRDTSIKSKKDVVYILHQLKYGICAYEDWKLNNNNNK